MQATRRQDTTDWLDRAALTASAACMVHCLALPLLVAAIPALSAVVAVPESFHRAVLLIAIPAAVLALTQGRRQHGAGWPWQLGATGVALLVAGAWFVPEGHPETVVTVAGSLLLAWAHVANWRLRRRCHG